MEKNSKERNKINLNNNMKAKVFIDEDDNLFINDFLRKVVDLQTKNDDVNAIFINTYRKESSANIDIYIVNENVESYVHVTQCIKLNVLSGINIAVHNIFLNQISFDNLYNSEIIYDKTGICTQIKAYLRESIMGVECQDKELIDFEPSIDMKKIKVKGE